MGVDDKPRLDGTKLVGVMLEGVCYGSLVVLLVLCLSVLTKRSKERRQTIFRPIFLITCLLFALITGHWVSSLLEIYHGFVQPRDVAYCVAAYGLTPAEQELMDLKNPYAIASSVFFVLTVIIGDWFLVYRLFIVWERNLFITIPPIIISAGVLVCGIVVSYLFSRADDPVFVVAQKWITATFSLSVGCNIYSTSLIALKLIGPRDEIHFQGLRKRVSEVLIQSAALYCLLAILVLAFSLASSNLVFVATSLTNPVVGINFCLIVIRTHNQVADVCLIQTTTERIEFTDADMSSV